MKSKYNNQEESYELITVKFFSQSLLIIIYQIVIIIYPYANFIS